MRRAVGSFSSVLPHFQVLLKLGHRQRTGEEVALALGAAALAQHGQLLHALDALGQQVQPEGPGLVKDGGQDLQLIFQIFAAEVEFQLVDADLAGRAQLDVIPVEAVQDHPEAGLLQPGHRVLQDAVGLQIGAAADVDLQVLGRDAVLFQHILEEVGHVHRQDIRLGDVDRDGHRADALVHPLADQLADLFPDVLVQLGDVAVAFQHRDKDRRGNDPQSGVVPADQSLGADHLAGVQLIPGLEEKDEFVLFQAVQDLGHQDLLVAGGAAAAHQRHGALFGQALQQLDDLPVFPAVAVAALLFGGGDDGPVELFQEEVHLPAHDVAQDVVDHIEKDGQDQAGDGRVKRGVDAGQDGLYTAKRGFHRHEVDPPQAHQQAQEGAQDAQAGHGAGDLGRHALPAVQAQDVLVNGVVDVADEQAVFPLLAHLFPVLLEQLVQRFLLKETVHLEGHHPGGAALRVHGPLDAVLTVAQAVGERDHRSQAVEPAGQRDDAHTADDHQGQPVGRIGRQHAGRYEIYHDKKIRKPSHDSLHLLKYPLYIWTGTGCPCPKKKKNGRNYTLHITAAELSCLAACDRRSTSDFQLCVPAFLQVCP